MRVSRLLQTSVVLACAPFAAACGRATSAATKEAAPLAIVVAKVEAHDLRRSIDVIGTLAADEEVTVSSEVEGRVLRIAADLGDRVTAGQALVVLDPEKLQYRLDQQRATLARAMARYGVADRRRRCRPSNGRPTSNGPPPSSCRRTRGSSAPAELQRRKLLPQQPLDDADATLKTEAGEPTSPRCRTRRTCAPTSTSERAN